MNDIRFFQVVGAIALLIYVVHRSAGRLTPRVFFAPLVFLLTRKPVLIAWGIGAIGMMVMVVSGGPHNGQDPSDHLVLFTGLSLLCGLGFAALAVGLVFMVVRAFAPAPLFELEPGEKIDSEIVANHFRGNEARGGKLIVTDRRIGFRPHRFNVQLETWSAALGEVTGVRAEGMRMLLVGTRDGAEAWFVVMDQRATAEAIHEAVEAAA